MTAGRGISYTGKKEHTRLFRHLGYPSDGLPEGLHAIAQVIGGVEFRPEAETGVRERD